MIKPIETSRPRGRPRQIGTENPAAKALDKGLLVLKAIAETDGISLNDLSLDLDIPVATLHRLLTTLELHGFASQSQIDARWSVGIEAFRVGSAFPRAAKILDLARPVLRQLALESGETANLGVLDQQEVIFTGQHETHHAIRAFMRPGSRSPWHASGIGKVIAAFLDIQHRQALINSTKYESYTANTLSTKEDFRLELERIRERYYSLDDEERHSGMRCVAAPIFDASGNVVAGISVSGPIVRMSSEEIPRFAEQTKRAGETLSKLLGAPERTQ